VSKAKAMDLCLTGRMMDAVEAERAGLVARVVPADKLLDEALTAAATIASYSLPVIMMIKESINRSFESGLNEGLLFERRVFHQLRPRRPEGRHGRLRRKRKAEFKNQ
jgi:enoyl-CoA hydratase